MQNFKSLFYNISKNL